MPKMRNDTLASFEELDAALRYDPDTGKLYWKIDRPGPQRADGEAGWCDQLGYVAIMYNYRTYMAHRIVWLLAHREWPAHMIDHINGNPSDNRLSNLRPATDAQNQANRRAKAKSATGLKGVRRFRNRFQAAINVDGKREFLGSFKEAADAAAAYERAAERIHGEFAVHNRPAGGGT